MEFIDYPDIDRLFDLLDIAAKKYPIKALAPEIDKNEKTLRAELTREGTAKLGLTTSILIMHKAWHYGGRAALDLIESFFGRVAFDLPRPEPGDMRPVMRMVGSLSREFGESMTALATALDDGRVTPEEAEKCLKENQDLITACVLLKAYLEQFVTYRGRQ